MQMGTRPDASAKSLMKLSWPIFIELTSAGFAVVASRSALKSSREFFVASGIRPWSFGARLRG